MGVDDLVFNVVTRTGDMFLTDGKPAIALDLFREASFQFPDNPICYIRQAQCQIILVSVICCCPNTRAYAYFI